MTKEYKACWPGNIEVDKENGKEYLSKSQKHLSGQGYSSRYSKKRKKKKKKITKEEIKTSKKILYDKVLKGQIDYWTTIKKNKFLDRDGEFVVRYFATYNGLDLEIFVKYIKDRNPHTISKLNPPYRKKKKGKKEKWGKKHKYTKPDYYAHIKSKEWAKFRRKAIKNAHGRCNVCNNTRNLQVHHKTYKNLGNERLEDVQVLCNGCHLNKHEGNVFGVYDPMTQEFLDIVSRVVE